ncbi:uncharacterized protein [Salminus brasiliensis]
MNQGSSVFKSNEVSVNTQCLLELFQYCWLCQIECCINIEGNERRFSITQDCQSCGHHRQWRSHPALKMEHKEQGEIIREDIEDEDAALYPEGEHSPEAGDEDEEEEEEEEEEVMIQIVSSDNEGTEQNCDQVFIEKDGSYLPKDEEGTGELEEQRNGKRASQRQGCSDEVAAGSDIPKDEGVFILEEVEKRKLGKRVSRRQGGLDEGAADSDISKDEGVFIMKEVEKINMGKRESHRQDSLDEGAADSDLSKDEGVFIVKEVEKRNMGKRESKRQGTLDGMPTHSDLSKDEGVFIVGEAEKRNTRMRRSTRRDGFYEVAVDSDCSMDEDLFGLEEEEKKEAGKRKSRKQDSSDEWEPRLDEVAADTDISMDEDLFNFLTEDSKGKVVVWCAVCRTDATLPCSLSHHKKVFACAQCGAGDHIEMRSFENLVVHFSDFPSFQKHAEKEHGARPFHKLCQECGKLVIAKPTSSGRKDHQCEKLKLIVCPECGKRFLTEVGLKRHFSKLHKDADHPCKYCLKLFKNRPSKLEHEQTHPKEKEPYSCPDCPERFDNIHRRNNHLKLHRGPYKYACDSCGKRFRDIIMLKRHKLIHSGEKPFRCHVCDRSFNQIGNLSSHMRLHTGEKPFMCEQCGECFNHNVSLKNHLLRYHYSGLPQTETKWQGNPDNSALSGGGY